MLLRSIRIALASVLAIVASASLASSATAYTLGPYPGSPITLPDVGQGQPYPPNFTLGSAGGKLSSMTVQINVSHTFTGDIDLMVVSPQGKGVILMSDNCGSQATSDMSFQFSDAAASELPATATCSSGTYKPSNFASTNPDVFPDPAPASPSSTLSVFNGSDPTGTWRLYAVDDAAGDAGTINSWSITFEMTSAEISIPEFDTDGTAGPYPSTKTFETPPGQVVSDVEVEIHGFGHQSPEDVDMLLADDKGDAAVVMSDTCGTDPLYDMNWSFSDLHPTLLGSGPGADCSPSDVIPSNYRAAANYGVNPSPDVDRWPSPAPTPQEGRLDEVFAGREGGKWSLYVVDDHPGGYGYINDWSLNLTTRPATVTGFAKPTLELPEGKTGLADVFRDGPNPYGPATLTASAESGSATTRKDFWFPTRKFQLDPKQLSVQFSVSATDDGIAEKAENFKLVLSNPEGDAGVSAATRSVLVTIPASKNATLKLGKLKLKKSKGTASLVARISSPGRLVTAGKGVKKSSKKLKKAGKARLTIRPKGKAKRSLAKTGKAKVKARVTYTTLGGRKVTQTRTLTLRAPVRDRR